MDDKEIWDTPEIEPLTEPEARADQADISARNGNSAPG
jgi:hypothetical protein